MRSLFLRSADFQGVHLLVKLFQVCAAIFIHVNYLYFSLKFFCTSIMFLYFFDVFFSDIVSGAWNMKDRTLYQGATVQSWGLVVCGRFPRNKIDHFKTCLWRAA